MMRAQRGAAARARDMRAQSELLRERASC